MLSVCKECGTLWVWARDRALFQESPPWSRMRASFSLRLIARSRVQEAGVCSMSRARCGSSPSRREWEGKDAHFPLATLPASLPVAEGSGAGGRGRARLFCRAGARGAAPVPSIPPGETRNPDPYPLCWELVSHGGSLAVRRKVLPSQGSLDRQVQGVSLRDGKSSTAGSKNTTKLVHFVRRTNKQPRRSLILRVLAKP